MGKAGCTLEYKLQEESLEEGTALPQNNGREE